MNMEWKAYEELFDSIIKGDHTEGIYSKESYPELVRLNLSRVKRWLSKGELNDELVNLIQLIDQPQKWILITEPWCGDAAHTAPFIKLISDINPLIDLQIQLRDSGSEIDSYLTNGGKAMPKLIVRNQDGQDLFTWGPRTKDCTDLVLAQKKLDLSSEEKKIEQQRWYNKDKGNELQSELKELVCANVTLCREMSA